MAIENYYNSMTRLTPTQNKNNKLEPVRTYATSSLNAKIGSRSDIEINSQGKITIKTQYKFYSDTLCNERDIIKYNSKFYRLISDMSSAGNKLHHYRGYVEKIAGIDS